jgi:hypothetical protein
MINWIKRFIYGYNETKIKKINTISIKINTLNAERDELFEINKRNKQFINLCTNKRRIWQSNRRSINLKKLIKEREDEILKLRIEYEHLIEKVV